jgi:hypothetical protein
VVAAITSGGILDKIIINLAFDRMVTSALDYFSEADVDPAIDELLRQTTGHGTAIIPVAKIAAFLYYFLLFRKYEAGKSDIWALSAVAIGR